MTNNRSKYVFSAVITAVVSISTVYCFAEEINSSDRLYGVREGSSFVSGELVITFAEGVSTAGMLTAIEETGGELARRSSVNRSRVVSAVPSGEEDKYISEYKKTPGIEIVEKNYMEHRCPLSVGKLIKDLQNKCQIHRKL